jgi:hypothetical protein
VIAGADVKKAISGIAQVMPLFIGQGGYAQGLLTDELVPKLKFRNSLR